MLQYMYQFKKYTKRVCPKITNRHLFLDSFSKMNVELVTLVNLTLNNYLYQNCISTYYYMKFRFLVIQSKISD